MQISSSNYGYAMPKIQNNKINFGATPQQVIQKLDTAQLCPGKKGMLKNMAEFFIGIENKMKQSADLPDKFEYNLTKPNKISEKMAKLTSGGKGPNANSTLKDFDDTFSKGTFKCSPTSTCSCGKGFSLSEFASQLLAKIGCDEPEKITISK